MNNKENLNKTIAQIFESRYIVPLYQRNFAWREEQVVRLLQDIYQAYKLDRNGNYFIGSLIVKMRMDEDYEIIDGQQRLTVLSLITKLLGINSENKLFYDSRPIVSDFLKAFYENKDLDSLVNSSTIHLRQAVTTIETTNLAEGNDGGTPKYIYDADKIVDADFADYFANNVILVRVEIPEDTDVASYFEIMNNRGEQLQEHEIIKAALIGELKDEENNYDIAKQKEFSLLWNVCSQMDIPIQKLFSAEKRRQYFGSNYDEFCFNGLTSGTKEEFSEGYTIDDILVGRYSGSEIGADETITDEPEDFEITDESKYSAIIDFPNFLMHIFKAFYDDVYKTLSEDKRGVPLDASFMIEVYERLKKHINPEVFIGQLFRTKTFFDRYIVKATISKDNNDDKDDDDKITWSLVRPCNDRNSLKYNNTFGNLHNRAVKALSMLQVTYRTRKYKNWLQECIKWFSKQVSIDIEPKEYIKFLDNYIYSRTKDFTEERNFHKIEDGDSITRGNSLSDGVRTPHVIFNFIDYLYWVEHFCGVNHDIRHSEKIKDFDFKYWNSVEHHLSRKKASELDGADDYIDNLGNLCLINKSANSRLSDRDVKEKVQSYASSNMGANRQIIYMITIWNNYEWDEKNITDHYNDLLELLDKSKEILGI